MTKSRLELLKKPYLIEAIAYFALHIFLTSEHHVIKPAVDVSVICYRVSD